MLGHPGTSSCCVAMVEGSQSMHACIPTHHIRMRRICGLMPSLNHHTSIQPGRLCRRRARVFSGTDHLTLYLVEATSNNKGLVWFNQVSSCVSWNVCCLKLHLQLPALTLPHPTPPDDPTVLVPDTCNVPPML